MQVVSHSLTHRGRSASRTRARWQPYAAIPPSMRTPSSACLHTPSSSSSSNVSTPAPALHNSICEPDNAKPLPSRSNSVILSQPSKDIREVHKHKYVTGLVGERIYAIFPLRGHGAARQNVQLLRRAFPFSRRCCRQITVRNLECQRHSLCFLDSSVFGDSSNFHA